MSQPTVIILGGYDKHADFHPLFRAFGGKVRAIVVLGQTKEQILREATRLRCNIIRCEENSDRGFLKREINRYPGFSVWAKTYNESQSKKIKIETYLRQAWGKIRFLEGTDREYIDQILDYTEYAEHDDAPDSAATLCRFFSTHNWEGKR